MTNRQSVWQLLLSREGEWVSLTELRFVGGHEATRRIRELRTGLMGKGYDIEDRVLPDSNEPHYRLNRLGTQEMHERGLRCVQCDAPPAGLTEATMDPRWRRGRCPACNDSDAIFKVPQKVSPLPEEVSPQVEQSALIEHYDAEADR